jgi:putative FmdB family regulatory protein
MPVYEYLCQVCESRFETRRSMAEANSPVTCPQGHGDTRRLLSVFATVGAESTQAQSPGGGGGCGPGCACAHQ